MRQSSLGSPGGQAHRLLLLMRALNRASQYQERFFSAEHDLSPSQGHLLGELWTLGPLPMGEIAERLRITPSTATRIVNLVEKRGLVRRRMAREDRRQQVVSLTPRGEETYENLEASALHVQRGILAQVPAHEREFLLTALSRVLSAQERYLTRMMPLEST